MRKTNNAKLIYDKHTFIGVDFGISYCDEHGQGCIDIQNAFGVDRSLVGIDGFKMNRYPDEDCTLQVVRFHDRMQQMVALYFDTKNPGFKTNNRAQYYLPKPNTCDKDEICAAWDNESFGLVLHNSRKNIIDNLMTAIKNNDLVIKMGSGANECEGGFCLLIASRIPKTIKDEMLSNDRDTQKLYEAVSQTGIAEYLQRHRKNYYSLNPMWLSSRFETDRGEPKTKYKVIFFLNPCEQHKYNSGWFTVEELKDWAKDRGPVCRNNMTTKNAGATLKDLLFMEQSIVALVGELKKKIVSDIKSSDMSMLNPPHSNDNGKDIVDREHATSYYSPKLQGDAVSCRLKFANTASEFLGKIDSMIREGAVRSEVEIIELNPITLSILKEYLSSI